MTYYRVSKKIYSVGTEIGPSGHSSSQDTEIGRKIEAMLDAVRAAEFPDKPRRQDGAYLFSNEICAQRYWWKMTAGRIYTVQIDEADILHRGDMMLLHEMEDVINAKGDPTVLARSYWRGERSERPCEELLVRKAHILEAVTPSDKQSVFKRLYRKN